MTEIKPITDEKLAELDAWYSRFTSNSFELKFCDADYRALRERLRWADEALNCAAKFFKARSSGESMSRQVRFERLYGAYRDAAGKGDGV